MKLTGKKIVAILATIALGLTGISIYTDTTTTSEQTEVVVNSTVKPTETPKQTNALTKDSAIKIVLALLRSSEIEHCNFNYYEYANTLTCELNVPNTTLICSTFGGVPDYCINTMFTLYDLLKTATDRYEVLKDVNLAVELLNDQNTDKAYCQIINGTVAYRWEK